MSMLEDLKRLLETPEGEERFNNWLKKNQISEMVENDQLERFNAKFGDSASFDEIVTKIVNKYNSDKYRDKWYGIGIEPPEELYFFLFKYAQKYGRECTDSEWKEHANMFTSQMYFVFNYYFNRMDGQGCCIKISKIR